VISAEDIRANPAQSLTLLCAALGIPFTDRMLHWPQGPKPYDGVWAPHWYNVVHRSTGFEDPESTLPELKPDYAELAEGALPAYHRLVAHKL
jgi:hypothetical protein